MRKNVGLNDEPEGARRVALPEMPRLSPKTALVGQLVLSRRGS